MDTAIIQIWDKLNNSKRLSIKILIGGILFIGAVIWSYGVDNLSQKIKDYQDNKPYVAVVLATKSIDFSIPKEFKVGLKQANPKNIFLAKKDKEVFLKFIESDGSKKDIIRITSALDNDKNCILIIGNSDSTTSEVAIDELIKDDEPIPYIMPIATATNLISKANDAGHNAVLRMIPDNESQTKRIISLVGYLDKNSPNIAIYGDSDNKSYSIDLMRGIASGLRNKNQNIIIEELIGNQNSFHNTISVWENNLTRPDILIYAGVGHNANLLIDQLFLYNFNNIPIILTDGSMDNTVYKNCQKIKNKVYVVSPIDGTYKKIGHDTNSLLENLISKCKNDCTRNDMRLVIENVKKGIEGSVNNYRFNTSGNNAEMKYKIYLLENGKLKIIDSKVI